MPIPRQNELGTVAVLSICWALALFDITGIDYLMPFIASGLKLDNTQIGLLFSLYWLPFGASSYLTGEVTDRLGKRRTLLLVVMLLFSLASVLPGFANVVRHTSAGPTGHGSARRSDTAVGTDDRRHGIPGRAPRPEHGHRPECRYRPVRISRTPRDGGARRSRWNWRPGFFVVALPGLICAALIALSLRRAPETRIVVDADDPSRRRRRGLGEVLRHRNVWLCVLCACFFTAFVLIGKGYLPLFYVRLRHMSPQRMSVLFSILSISSLTLGVLFPALADRIGRKPAAVISSLLGAVFPLAGLYYAGPDILLGLLMFIGWAPAGASILYLATIPAESVPANSISSAIGLTFAIGTLVGGFLGPAIAGWSADRWGLQSALLLQAGCAVAMAVIALGFQETKPNKTH
jgi:ACS family hexuronate transporter-like MFS transporter